MPDEFVWMFHRIRNVLLHTRVLGCWREAPQVGRAKSDLLVIQVHVGFLACAGVLWVCMHGALWEQEALP
eukprot:10386836-Alexandrium_andersonii.AAC.1